MASCCSRTRARLRRCASRSASALAKRGAGTSRTATGADAGVEPAGLPEVVEHDGALIGRQRVEGGAADEALEQGATLGPLTLTDARERAPDRRRVDRVQLDHDGLRALVQQRQRLRAHPLQHPQPHSEHVHAGLFVFDGLALEQPPGLRVAHGQ